MSYLIKKSGVHSPESTVSSLLKNCSFNSGSDSLNSHSSIKYKDKLYRSASQALEAYIEDFDLSLASPDIRPGKICITQSTLKYSKSSEDSFKHALKNFKQREKLVSDTPYLKNKTVNDLDKFSLTTDDLLAFPADGSASFTQRSALRKATQTGTLNKRSLTKFASRVHHQTSSLGHKELNYTESSLYKDSNRKGNTKHKLFKHDSSLPVKDQLIELQDSEFVSHKNYPRWLTSQKTDLCISGISSVPDFKYPIWLKSHNLLSDSSNGNSALAQDVECDLTFLQDNKNLAKSQPLDRTITSGHSGNDEILSQQYKRCASKNSQYSVPHECFTPQPLKDQDLLLQEDGTELLLQKAQITPRSSAEELTTSLKNDDSPCTVDILEAGRSWDNVPVGLKSPVPVYCEDENSLQSPKANIVNGFLEDCLKSSSQESTFSGGNHHGPVEALKLMLFNLQAVQHSFNQDKTAGQKEEFKNTLDEDGEFKLCDSNMIPIRQSLQRALHHLSRLKCLVEDTGSKEKSK